MNSESIIAIALFLGVGLLLWFVLRLVHHPAATGEQQQQRGGDRSKRFSLPVAGGSHDEVIYVTFAGFLGYHLWFKRWYSLYRQGIARTHAEELLLFVTKGPGALLRSRKYKSYVHQLLEEDAARRRLSPQPEEDPLSSLDEEAAGAEDGGGQGSAPSFLPPSSSAPPPVGGVSYPAWDTLLAVEQRGGLPAQWALHAMIGYLLLLCEQGENLSRHQLVDKKHYLSDSQYQYLIGSPDWSETRHPGLLRRAGVVSTHPESRQTTLTSRDAVQLYLQVTAFQVGTPNWWTATARDGQNASDAVENEREIADEEEEKEDERNEYDDESGVYTYRRNTL